MNSSNHRNTFSAAIVGLGNIGLCYDLECPGETVMTHTAACLRHPDVSLVAGIDPDETARRTFERTAGCAAYPDLARAALTPGQLDLLIVSTPTAVRLPVVERCVTLRPRAILLEKPLADNREEGRAIVDLCRGRGILLAVNYFRRFDEKIASIGRDIRSGRFGPLCHGSCLYSGGLLNNASHYVDLLVDWFGMPDSPRSLSTDRDCRTTGSPNMFALDYGPASIVFREIDAGYGIGELDLLFERGRVRFENYCEDLIVMRAEADAVFPSYRRLVRTFDRGGSPDLDRYQYHVLDRIVAAMRDRVDIPSTGETALEVLKICLEVIRSADVRKPRGVSSFSR